jgi:hypothetical protein
VTLLFTLKTEIMTTFELTEHINDRFDLDLDYQAIRRHITRQLKKGKFLKYKKLDYGKNDVLPKDVRDYFIEKYREENSTAVVDSVSSNGVRVRIDTGKDFYHPATDHELHKVTDPQPEDYVDNYEQFSSRKNWEKEDLEKSFLSADRLDHFLKYGPDSYPDPPKKEDPPSRDLEGLDDEDLTDQITFAPYDSPKKDLSPETVPNEVFRLDLADLLLSSKNLMTIFIIAALIFQAHLFSNLQLRVLAGSAVQLGYWEGLLMGFLFDASGVYLAKNMKAIVRLPYDDRIDPRNVWILIFFLFQVAIDLSFVNKFGSYSDSIGAVLIALTVPLTLAAFSSLVLKDAENKIDENH